MNPGFGLWHSYNDVGSDVHNINVYDSYFI